jgi:hypothetical protein
MLVGSDHEPLVPRYLYPHSMPRSTPLAPLTFTEPMECKAVINLPTGADWNYELKLDGYRAQVLRDTDTLRILSKNGNDLTARFPHTAGVSTGMIENLHRYSVRVTPEVNRERKYYAHICVREMQHGRK